jgi:hypothetical protein
MSFPIHNFTTDDDDPSGVDVTGTPMENLSRGDPSLRIAGIFSESELPEGTRFEIVQLIGSEDGGDESERQVVCVVRIIES